MVRQWSDLKPSLLEPIPMKTYYLPEKHEIKPTSLVVSATHCSRVWVRVKIMKTVYLIKDSVNMMLVACLRVLKMKS